MDRDRAEALVARDDFVWHQRWELAEGVLTPGTNQIARLMDVTGVPERLDGMTVLDIGTTNGGAAFLAESRGAEHVVAVDLYPPSWFGFDVIADALHSKVEFVQGSVYDLPQQLGRTFDLVFFYGVLYHLRHPLLALDALHALTERRLFVETAASGKAADVEFYPGEYLGDSSNWFIPSTSAIRDWFQSSGWRIEQQTAWPPETPSRCALTCVPTHRTFIDVSYEVPLRVVYETPDKVYGQA